MSNIISVDDTNFELEVLRSSAPVLVDLTASWCTPCQGQLSIIEQFAAQHPEVKVVKVDVDDAYQVSSHYKIRSVPSVMLFNEGQKLDMRVGLTTLSGLNSLLSEKLR